MKNLRQFFFAPFELAFDLFAGRQKFGFEPAVFVDRQLDLQVLQDGIFERDGDLFLILEGFRANGRDDSFEIGDVQDRARCRSAPGRK